MRKLLFFIIFIFPSTLYSMDYYSPSIFYKVDKDEVLGNIKCLKGKNISYRNKDSTWSEISDWFLSYDKKKYSKLLFNLVNASDDSSAEIFYYEVLVNLTRTNNMISLLNEKSEDCRDLVKKHIFDQYELALMWLDYVYLYIDVNVAYNLYLTNKDKLDSTIKDTEILFINMEKLETY